MKTAAEIIEIIKEEEALCKKVYQKCIESGNNEITKLALEQYAAIRHLMKKLGIETIE